MGHKWTICKFVRAAMASSLCLNPVSFGSQSYHDAKNSGLSRPIRDALSEVKLRALNNSEPLITSLGAGLLSFFSTQPAAIPTEDYFVRTWPDTSRYGWIMIWDQHTLGCINKPPIRIQNIKFCEK